MHQNAYKFPLGNVQDINNPPAFSTNSLCESVTGTFCSRNRKGLVVLAAQSLSALDLRLFDMFIGFHGFVIYFIDHRLVVLLSKEIVKAKEGFWGLKNFAYCKKNCVINHWSWFFETTQSMCRNKQTRTYGSFRALPMHLSPMPRTKSCYLNIYMWNFGQKACN